MSLVSPSLLAGRSHRPTGTSLTSSRTSDHAFGLPAPAERSTNVVVKPPLDRKPDAHAVPSCGFEAFRRVKPLMERVPLLLEVVVRSASAGVPSPLEDGGWEEFEERGRSRRSSSPTRVWSAAISRAARRWPRPSVAHL